MSFGMFFASCKDLFMILSGKAAERESFED